MAHRKLTGLRPRPEGAKSPLEVGDRKLFTIAQVRAELDMHSRKPFMDFLSLILGAHPTEKNIQAFANQNPDKWASAVKLFSGLAGYHDQLEVNHNIYATVVHMSDMDLEHQLRDINSKIGDSHLVDPDILDTPYKRVDQRPSALSRIKNSK